MRCQKCGSEKYEVLVKDEYGFPDSAIDLNLDPDFCPFCGHILLEVVGHKDWNDYWIDEIIDLITEWGDKRKITKNGKPITQAIKTLEECHELLEAVNRNDKEEIIDAIGDIIVTLTMQCALQDIRLYDCILSAYDEIKDRTGHLNEVGDYIRDK